MAFTYTEITNNTTVGPFSYAGIVLLDGDTEAVSTQLKVYKNGVLLTLATNYTINTGLQQVTLVAALIATDVLRIIRETKRDARYVDYVDSTNVTAELLDLDSNQNFFLIQEGLDLQSDAMIRGTDGQWAGRGYQIKNIAAGTDGTDAVNLNQLQAAVVGALPATLSGLGYVVYTGDAVEDTFALPAAIQDITDPGDVEVFVNGIRQLPVTHYSIVGDDVLLAFVPAVGDKVLLAWPEGVVAGIVSADSVLTASIQNDAVTAAKIAPGSNGQVLAAVAGESAWTTLAASYVSDFDTQVRTSRLDQMAAPTASVSAGSQKITNLGTPTSGTDAATKTYVDGQPALTSKTSIMTSTGSVTSVNCSFDAGFQIGAFTVTVPITQSGALSTFTASGVVTSANSSSTNNNVRVFVPDTDAGGGAYFTVARTRSGGSNNTLAFTIARAAQSATSADIDIVVGTVYGQFSRGSS